MLSLIITAVIEKIHWVKVLLLNREKAAADDLETNKVEDHDRNHKEIQCHVQSFLTSNFLFLKFCLYVQADEADAVNDVETHKEEVTLPCPKLA